MTFSTPNIASGNDQAIPQKRHRRRLEHEPHKRRTCRDNRPYFIVPYTIRGTLVVQRYNPPWTVDRDYWCARATAEVGSHDTGTHTADGCPTGSAAKFQLRRISVDLADDDPILASDNRLQVLSGHHADSISNGSEGVFTRGDFALNRLYEGEQVYLEVVAVGSTNPGTDAVVNLILVPYPWPGREE